MSNFPKHDAVMKYAQHCLGIFEMPNGSNHGPIQRQNPNGGVDFFEEHDFVAGTGYAWCACFVLSAWEVGAHHPLPYKSPGAYAQGNYWRAHGHAVTIDKLVPGDPIVWRVGSGHISLFEGREGSTIHTIDGNSQNRVMRDSRSAGLIHTAIHIPEDPAHLPPKAPEPFWVIATSVNGHKQILFTKFATKAFILNKVLPPIIAKYGKAGITIKKGGVKK